MLRINNVVLMGTLSETNQGFTVTVVEKFTDRQGKQRINDLIISLSVDAETHKRFDDYLRQGKDEVLVEGALCFNKEVQPWFHYLDVKRAVLIEDK